jgi:hypothetical protein
MGAMIADRPFDAGVERAEQARKVPRAECGVQALHGVQVLVAAHPTRPGNEIRVTFSNETFSVSNGGRSLDVLASRQ